MADVKLLGLLYSFFSHRVEWALKIKGVKYEFIEEDLQNKSPLLLQSNPIHKKIPVLIHNGKSICESTIILEYIDETFEGPSILPKDLYDRFLDDKIIRLHVIYCYLHNLVNLFETNVIFDHCMTYIVKNNIYVGGGSGGISTFIRKGEEQEKGKEEACEMLKVLDNELKDKKFFVGDKFGFADIAANLVGYWLGIFQEASGVELVTSEKFPIFCAWRDEYINYSQVKEYLPPRHDELLAFFQGCARAHATASASTQK